MAQSWIAIRLSGALAILGSLLTLLSSGALLWTALNAKTLEAPSEQPFPLRGVLMALAAFFAVLTVWGMATGLATLRRRAWARASIIVIAVLLVGMGVSAVLGVLFIRMPQPANLSDAAMLNIRVVIAAFYSGLTLIGTWWLLLFNSRRAKEYFAAAPAPESARPLSISIIGWYLLLCAVGTGLAATMRVPAVLFGAIVGSWGALGVYTAYTAIEIYLGTGLLQVQKPARLGAIVYFGFVAANTAVSVALPGFAQRMRILQGALPQFMRQPLPASVLESSGTFALAGLVLIVVPIWFLVRRRAAFA